MTQELATRRRDELAALVAKHGGTVTPAQVVAFAQNPRTALHALFDWDDANAAARYREVQAAHYIRAVVKTLPREDGQPLVVRAYVALTVDRGEESFRPIESVLDDPARRAQLIQDARRELEAFRRKYGHLEELTEVWEVLDGVEMIAA